MVSVQVVNGQLPGIRRACTVQALLRTTEVAVTDVRRGVEL